jgi:molecular chaperone GrpE|tara:strand:+ start:895 stop:1521 length:627 start_codon:yes stop_codon:yes gene_type:complete
MDKEDIGMDPKDHEETQNNEEETGSLTDNEEKVGDSDVETEEVEKTLEELKEENKTLSDKMMRALAETENIRKKFFKEKKDAEIYGGTKLARDILSVLDNLNRALESVDDEMIEKQNAFLEGIELTKKELLNTFSNHEINELAPKEGEKFDPKFHQAMFEAPHTDIDKGNIIQVMANGFTIGERLLRAAQVGVSSGVIQDKKEGNQET